MIAAHFSKAYQTGRERAWHLAIWKAPAVQAWTVHDIRTNGCVALTATNGPELPNEDRLPVHPASVSFIAVPEISTLVPEGVLQEGSEAAQLELVHGPLPHGKLRHTPIDVLGARCIYQHDEAAELPVLKRFPSARPIALHALLIKAALARAVERPVLLLHRMEQRCDVVIAAGSHVRLANSFPASTATDLLYFALFALDRTGLGPADVRLCTGGMALHPEDRSLLERYFTAVVPAVPGNDGTLAGLGIETPERFLALLEQRSCAS